MAYCVAVNKVVGLRPPPNLEGKGPLTLSFKVNESAAQDPEKTNQKETAQAK